MHWHTSRSRYVLEKEVGGRRGEIVSKLSWQPLEIYFLATKAQFGPTGISAVDAATKKV